MITRLTQRHARAIALATAFLLFVVLFFHWHKAPVQTQWIDESRATTALLGYGAIVVGLLVAYFLVELFFGLRGRRVGAILAGGAALFTFAEFFLSSPAVSRIEGTIVSSSEQTLWPAYAGLALAVLFVLAALNRLFAPPPEWLPMPPMAARAEGMDVPVPAR